MAMAFGLTSGALWMIAYALLVYRSFKDRSYAMPMAALALNITWEFVFSFAYLRGSQCHLVPARYRPSRCVVAKRAEVL